VTERLQKVLAAAGVASRREVESWIRAGRVAVNDRPATLGQRVGPDDKIAVDGRRVRLEHAAPGDLVLIYHRPPGEALKEAGEGADSTATSTYERLPSVRGRRWLPLSPLAPTDGGLELFTTDGTLRAAASRAAAADLTISYAVRVNGEPTEELIASLAGRALAADPAFVIEAARTAGGEGRNRWYEFDTRRARGRDLRELLLGAGLEVSRILRTRFGPMTMDRALSRGRHRELTQEERDALYAAVGISAAGSRPRPATRQAQRPGPGTRGARPTPPRSRDRAGKGRSR
jgi:23S rRNA pseudouridine2605 synthase